VNVVIREEITTGQIYRVQADFGGLQGSYVKVLRVNGDKVNLVRTKDKIPSYHVVPVWVIEQSKLIFIARQEKLPRSKTIWAKIMDAIKS
jgi:hypothetical protein